MNKIFSRFKTFTLSPVLFFSLGFMTAEAQTRKVVMQDFSFFPFISQKSADNPLLLPYSSKSTFISIKIDKNEVYESVQEFLDDYESPVKKSLRVETISGLSSGWVVEENEGNDKNYLLTGMLKNNTTGVSLSVIMEYKKTDKASERNAMTMFRSFRPNTVVKTPVVVNKPAIPPLNNNTGTVALNILEVLTAHNNFRSEIGVPALTWSNELANIAQGWANELARKNCSLEHSSSDYGENLASGSSGYSIPMLIQMWGDEKKDFNPDTRKCYPGRLCGHYTQVIWKKTTQVGCALAKCADGNLILVCNYNPAGNFNDEPAY